MPLAKPQLWSPTYGGKTYPGSVAAVQQGRSEKFDPERHGLGSIPGTMVKFTDS
jgi:hypothetical protein